jgi:uncharacterized Fe-S cluster-containing MiaB family protein
MKKILVLVMVCVASATSTYAVSPAECNAFYKLNNKTAFESLVGYIDADKEQVNFLKEVFKVTEKELKAAVNNGNDSFAEKVVNYNLSNTKFMLTEEQYKKYLVFVNVYLKNENNFDMLSEVK